MNCSKLAKALAAVVVALSASVVSADESRFVNQLSSLRGTVVKAAEGASAVVFRPSTKAQVNSPWALVERDYRVGWPKIQIHNTFYPVASLCADGDFLLPQSGPYEKTCVRVGDRESNECLEERPMLMAARRRWTQTACTQWDQGTDGGTCLKTETFSGIYPLNYMVPVYERDHHDEPERLVFKKAYRIPACR